MNRLTKIKFLSCAYAFCMTDSILYAPENLFKKLFSCCFDSPQESPALSPTINPSSLQNFLILGYNSNPAAAPAYKIKPLDLCEKEGEEMEEITSYPKPPPPSPQHESSQSSFNFYTQMLDRNFRREAPQSLSQQENPPPPLIAQEEIGTFSRNSSDEGFVLISPRKQEFEA